MILALRALGIGDLATAVPALRGLRTAFPDRELALAAPAWLAPLAALIGGIDRLVDVPDLAVRDWSDLGRRPALAVNLHGRGPQSHRLLRAARPRRLLAFACAEAGHHHGPQWTSGEHEVHRWCRMLRWYGIAAAPTDLALARPDLDGRPAGVTVIHPGAKARKRRWPADRFAAVAGTLAGQDHRVVLTGTAAERPIAHRIAAAAGLPDTAVLAGTTDVGGLAALIAHARLLISGDTGAGHLATAFGTPSVLLFGPVPPHEWGPPAGRGPHQVLWAGPRPPARAGQVDPALVEISPAQVLDAVDRLDRPPVINGSRPATGGGPAGGRRSPGWTGSAGR
jgi:ADP-heptose:LPS heptosyltransferase